MPTTTRERYLAVVRWGWPAVDEDAEHFRSGAFPTLGAAKNWATTQTEDPDALVKVYREVWADGDWEDAEGYYYDPAGGWDDE